MTSLPADRTRLAALGVVVLRGTRRILDLADLAVDAGEVAVVEGASGCGKTTLLRAVATLIPRDGGTVRLGNVDDSAISPVVYRRRVAYVPQQPPMLEGTVHDNVCTGPRLAGLKTDLGAVVSLLDRVGLAADLAPREARGLSGGERQRVALARALANRPEFLLLDEPTAALDPASAEHVIDLVRALGQQGLGVIVVTHIEEHARGLADSRYVCAEGRLKRKA